MKKYKKFIVAVAIILVILLGNLGYYLFTNWQNFFPNQNASAQSSGGVDLTSYSNSKIRFEVKYPEALVLKDEGDIVEIDASSGLTYFSVALRDDFTSLDQVKAKLAPDIQTAPIQIGDATGFEYNDSASYESIWLSHAGKIYIIRTYVGLSLSVAGANQILSTFKFTN